MMVKVFLFFIFITVELLSNTLKDTYYVDSKNIKLFDIFPNARYDLTLYTIDNNKHSKKIHTIKLLKKLKEHGYNSIETSGSYVKFILKSPIDTSKIKTYLFNIYKKKYPEMTINSIRVIPRGFIQELPKRYKIKISKNAHRSNDGIISIKSLDNKKIFFDYLIDANIDVYITKHKIQKEEKITLLNTYKKNIIFDKFRAVPINKKDINSVQTKFHRAKNIILTKRDVEGLDLVKKGSYVNISLKNQNINISFSAKALQNGKLNDIISVQKNNGHKLRVKIIAKNRAEIR